MKKLVCTKAFDMAVDGVTVTRFQAGQEYPDQPDRVIEVAKKNGWGHEAAVKVKPPEHKPGDAKPMTAAEKRAAEKAEKEEAAAKAKAEAAEKGKDGGANGDKSGGIQPPTGAPGAVAAGKGGAAGNGAKS